MAARRPEPSDPERLVPFNFRIPEKLVTALDGWLDEQNKERRVTPLNRSDLIRGVLSWAAKTKPEWEEGQFILLVADGDGDVVLRKSVRSISGAEITFTDDKGRARRATFGSTKVEGGQVVAYYLTDTIDDLPVAGGSSEGEAPGPKAPPGYLEGIAIGQALRARKLR